MPELDPCPFCGGTDIRLQVKSNTYRILRCFTCRAKGPKADDPFAAWNNRAAIHNGYPK